MKPEVTKAAVRGLVATVLLGTAILVGSRNLSHFDAALVAFVHPVR